MSSPTTEPIAVPSTSVSSMESRTFVLPPSVNLTPYPLRSSGPIRGPITFNVKIELLCIALLYCMYLLHILLRVKLLLYVHYSFPCHAIWYLYDMITWLHVPFVLYMVWLGYQTNHILQFYRSHIDETWNSLTKERSSSHLSSKNVLRLISEQTVDNIRSQSGLFRPRLQFMSYFETLCVITALFCAHSASSLYNTYYYCNNSQW